MTQAEAMVYAAAFHWGGRFHAYTKVCVLRGDEPKVGSAGMLAAADMLDDFRAFGHDGSGARGGEGKGDG